MSAKQVTTTTTTTTTRRKKKEKKSGKTVKDAYAAKEYEVPPPPELQCLELTTHRDATPKRTLHRVMNYHSISL